MVLAPRRVLRCRMTRKGATGCFGQEKRLPLIWRK